MSMMSMTSLSRLLSAAALCTLSALSAGAMAQTSAVQPGQPDAVRVSVNAPYHVTAQEAMSMERPYALSNGQILIVRQQDSFFYGRLALPREYQQKPEVQLIPTASGQFVTARGAAIAFELQGERVVIDDAQLLPGLRMPAGQSLADTGAGGSIRLVSR